MRIHLPLLFAAALPAAANPQTTNVNSAFTVGGNVPVFCAVGAPTLAAGRQVNFRGLNGSTLQIDQLVDSVSLSTNAASVELRFDSVCNLRHRLKLETQNNGLWPTSERGSVRPEGFGNAVPYRARISRAAQSLDLNADARTRRIAESSLYVDGAAIGEIMLRLEIDPGVTNVQANAPLVAGVYGDTLRIIVEPQQ